ncbi:MAG: hypothetical protein GX268_03840 [Methanomicrobiales archaeon]|jgi:hypothetical protein|nr:hypothetical protein [Methanomicrobiales archaeon]
MIQPDNPYIDIVTLRTGARREVPEGTVTSAGCRQDDADEPSPIPVTFHKSL